MHFKFTPTQFQRFGEKSASIACLANNLLDDFIATLPEVISTGTGPREVLAWVTEIRSINANEPNRDITHRARLWGIEEIKPKKCVHTIMTGALRLTSNCNGFEGVCDQCGKRLVARWEEA